MRPAADPTDAAYLAYLGRDDLTLLAQAGALPERTAAAVAAQARAEPGLLERLLAAPATFEAVLGGGEDREPLLGVSPFLVFAVAVQRTHADLAELRYVREWTGPRQRLPVLDTASLRGFLDAPRRRLFLAELLASYTRVASGSLWRQGARGRRRRVRFSELDLMGLAEALDALPEERRGPLYRRLGDLSLFLTGVFPDHTAGRLFRPIDLTRLGRAAAVAPGPGPGDELARALELRGGVGLLEVLGSRWYRLAAGAGERGDEPAGSARGLGAVAERFVEARRALNLVTDRHLFPLRDELLPAP